MKIDAFHYVQLGTAYRSVPPWPCPCPHLPPGRHFGLVVSVHPPRGLQPVPDEEVIELYGGTQHIPLYQMSGFYGKVDARSAHARGGLPALTPGPHCPWDSRAGGLAQPALLPQGPSIKQFMDIFSLPEMALLSCVVDHFLGHGLEFDQAHLYKDVTVRAWACAPGWRGQEPRHSRAGRPGLQ